MAVMTKAQARKFIDMDDKMIDILDYLKSKAVIDAKMHRTILLEGYKSLVDYLKQKKMINAREAAAAMKDGFNSLLLTLAK